MYWFSTKYHYVCLNIVTHFQLHHAISWSPNQWLAYTDYLYELQKRMAMLGPKMCIFFRLIFELKCITKPLSNKFLWFLKCYKFQRRWTSIICCKQQVDSIHYEHLMKDPFKSLGYTLPHFLVLNPWITILLEQMPHVVMHCLNLVEIS